jgi:PAS domain S-box-containing protein
MSENTTRILLIDDDEDEYVLIRDILSDFRMGLFEAEWVSTYEKGLARLLEDVHDVYLVDYRLGGTANGLDLLDEALAQHFCKPIIILTGSGSGSIDVEAMKRGAADYLDKSQILREALPGRTDCASSPDLIEPLLSRSLIHAIERTRAQNDLRRATEYVNGLIYSSLDMIICANEAGEIVEFNPAAESVYGYTRSEILGKPAASLFLDPPKRDEIRRIMTEGSGFRGNVWRLKKGGKAFLADTSAFVVQGAADGFAGYIGISRDITEQHKVAERYRKIIEEASGFIYELDTTGHYTYINPVAERVACPRRRRAVRYSWTKSAIFLRSCNRCCCACFRSGRSRDWANQQRARSTSDF